ncbi:MAG TPA: AMP-binding protein [Acidimicrobiales bacterium]|nr:AMP-binding protein [Acidimicrobiales bacterium]
MQTAQELAPTHPAGIVAARLRDPSRVAVRFPSGDGWATWTRNDLAAAVGRRVDALRRAGLRPGDRVGVVGPTSVDWLVAGYAVQAAGGVLVGAYPTSAPAQLRYVLGHSGSRIVFAATAVLDRLLPVLDDLPDLERVVVMDGPAPEAAATPALQGLDDFLDGAVTADDGAVAVLAAAVEALDPEGLCSIVYTSGTTGDPKGALHSFRTIAQVADTVAPAMGYTEDDQYVVHLPLNHLAEQTYGLVLGAHMGWTLNFVRSPATLLDDLAALRPTVMFGVPRVFEKVRSAVLEANLRGAAAAGHPLAGFGLDRLRVMVCGGAPLTPEMVEFFGVHGVKMVNSYGMTEGNAIATAWDRPPRGDTCGGPLPGVQIRLAPDGEVLVRSRGTCLGYFRDPDASAELFTDDGYIRTGDLGEWTPEGDVRLVGRKKEIIITAGGKNMSPAMIEHELTRGPFVNQAVVVGNGRRYLVAVLEPAAEVLAEHLGRVDPPAPDGGYEAVVADPRVAALLEDAVAAANANLSQPEQIKRWAILPHRFGPGDPVLTPTMKIRRNEFEVRLGDLIEELYQ